MGEEFHFRYIAKSDASLIDYPSNKAQHFKNRASAPIDLVGEWEVGLKEIVYPNNWYNIQKTGQFTLTFTVPVDDYVVIGRTRELAHSYDQRLFVKPIIEGGYYDTVNELLDHINESTINAIKEKIREFENSDPALPKKVKNIKPNEVCKFSLSVITQKVSIETNATVTAVGPGEMYKVFKHLGFDMGQNDETIVPAVGAHQASLVHHFPGLFLYSNLIRPSYVGDSIVPLLRFIPLSGKKLDLIEDRFELDTEYIKLTDNYINEMEFIICDDVGNEVQFQGGKVQLTLDFRLVGYHGN